MTINLYSSSENINPLQAKQEIGSIMCAVQGFLYANRVAFSYSKIDVKNGRLEGMIKIRHYLFVDIESEWSLYVIDLIRELVDSNIRMTVHDSE